MSVGDLKDYGNKGNNFPFQLKVLQGLQCVCDQLKEINIDTDDLEQLLADLIATLDDGVNVTIVNPLGQEPMATSIPVVIASDQSNVETNTHDGSGNPITSTAIGPDTGLDVNIIGGVTLDVNLDAANDDVGIYGYDAGTPTQVSVNASGHVAVQDAGGSLTVDNPLHDDFNANANIQVGDVDVSSSNPVPVTFPTGAETPYYIEYTGIAAVTPTPLGAKSVSLFNEGPGRWQLSSDGGANWINFNEGQIVEWTASEGKTLNSILFRKNDAGGRLIMSYTI